MYPINSFKNIDYTVPNLKKMSDKLNIPLCTALVYSIKSRLYQ